MQKKQNKKNTRTAMNTAGHIKGINENICLSWQDFVLLSKKKMTVAFNGNKREQIFFF